MGYTPTVGAQRLKPRAALLPWTRCLCCACEGCCLALTPLLPECTQLPPPQSKTLAPPWPLHWGGSALPWDPVPSSCSVFHSSRWVSPGSLLRLLSGSLPGVILIVSGHLALALLFLQRHLNTFICTV